MFVPGYFLLDVMAHVLRCVCLSDFDDGILCGGKSFVNDAMITKITNEKI